MYSWSNFLFNRHLDAMVNRKISHDMKQRALQLINEGWEPAEVADVLGVSSKSIERWDHNYETHGCINPPSALRGRPRIINAQAADDLQELIRETPLLFLDEIGEWLALYHDISISTAAIHNNLCDLGLTYSGSESSSRALFFVSTSGSDWLVLFWMELAGLRTDCDGSLIFNLKPAFWLGVGVLASSANCVS